MSELCSVSEDKKCCLHDLPDDHEDAPGRICCWCGDIFTPYIIDMTADTPHGEYKPVFSEWRVKK